MNSEVVDLLSSGIDDKTKPEPELLIFRFTPPTTIKYFLKCLLGENVSALVWMDNSCNSSESSHSLLLTHLLAINQVLRSSTLQESNQSSVSLSHDVFNYLARILLRVLLFLALFAVQKRKELRSLLLIKLVILS